MSLIAQRYEIIQKLGEGSSGSVYHVHDRHNPTLPTAIKIFLPSIPLVTIKKEFRVLQDIYHPNIIEIYDRGTLKNGCSYLTSEFIDGPHLIDYARNQTLKDKLKLLVELALVLDFIHQKNVFHLDLKPSNILMNKSRSHHVLKLLDFGFFQTNISSPKKLPQGTLAYMSPELLQRKKVDTRADIYAFGLIAHELLLGHLPFSPHDVEKMIQFHLYTDPSLLQTKEIPNEILKMIQICLQKNPLDRFQTGLDIAKKIDLIAKLKLDLKHYGPLQGTQRVQLNNDIKDFLTNLESVLKKEKGNLPTTVWTEQLRRLGRYEEALEHLSGLSKKEKELKDHAQYLKARILLEKGDYQSILKMSLHTSDQINTKGLAYYYLNQSKKADDTFKKVIHQSKNEISKGNAYNYLGMSAYSQQQYDQALINYQKSEEILRILDDKQPLISVLMNQGVLFQQTRNFKEALKSYEKSLALAQDTAHGYLLATLLNNLANLYIQFGAPKEAKTFLERSKSITLKIESPYLTAYNFLIEGDLCTLQGELEKSKKLYTSAIEQFEKLGASREVQITQNLLFDNAFLQNDLKEAEQYATSKTQKILVDLLTGHDHKIGDQDDVDLLVAKARYLIKNKKNDEALDFIEKAYQQFIQFRDAIPFDYQKAVQKHPQWIPVLKLKEKFGEEDPVKLANFKKLLEVSKKMTQEHHLSKLLEFIMDAVIEISGAERGFLILTGNKKKNFPFKINVARNLDQETIQKPAYKISRTLVEKVIEKEKPILITDAAADPRLKSSKSVQGLKLKSILCVPLLHRGQVLGGIYVENRFQKGVFTDDHIEILQAFADQAAIAIQNARLYEENINKAQQISELNDKLSSTLAKQTIQLEETKEKLNKQQNSLERRFNYKNIMGESKAMQNIFDLLDRITDREISVLITGESGTGKELIARALHFNSPRKEKEFVAINCSAIPSELLESELFGHVKGAFTGAHYDKVGLFEAANRGTLLLDEIGDMPLAMQAKLLRVLEEREIRRVGSHRKIGVDVRVVSATNKDLAQATKQKKFREDLYYRLNAVQIALPPLRERREDIPLIVSHLLKQITPREKIKISPQALNLLTHYEWPGNIRELKNELERAVSFADGEITPNSLSEKITQQGFISTEPDITSIRENRNQYEKSLIVRILKEAQGNKSLAAKNLGISRVALYQKINKLGINA